MRGTSDRLRANIDEETARLMNVAAGYTMAGEHTLANTAHAAALALHTALEAIDRHQQREAAAYRSIHEETKA